MKNTQNISKVKGGNEEMVGRRLMKPWPWQAELRTLPVTT